MRLVEKVEPCCSGLGLVPSCLGIGPPYSPSGSSDPCCLVWFGLGNSSRAAGEGDFFFGSLIPLVAPRIGFRALGPFWEGIHKVAPKIFRVPKKGP